MRTSERTGSSTAKNIIAVIVLIAVAVVVYFAANVSYTLGEDTLAIKHFPSTTSIAYADIDKLAYYEKMPALSNKVGIAVWKIRSGSFNFTVEGKNVRGYVFSSDNSRPFILITTKEAKYYGITPADAQSFYEELQKKVLEARRQ